MQYAIDETNRRRKIQDEYNKKHNITPTTTTRGIDENLKLEEYDDTELNALKGDRRFAWIWPKEVETAYDREKKKLTVSFYLPKGSYATTFLEEIGKFSLK